MTHMQQDAPLDDAKAPEPAEELPKPISTFGSFTATLSDGMVFALSNYGSKGSPFGAGKMKQMFWCGSFKKLSLCFMVSDVKNKSVIVFSQVEFTQTDFKFYYLFSNFIIFSLIIGPIIIIIKKNKTV